MTQPRTIIPFVHTFRAERVAAWMEALNAEAHTTRIKPLEACDAAERSQAKLAIIANPTAEDLATLPHLKWVQGLWAGVENVLPALAPHIDIVRMTDPRMAETMSEAVLAWTLYLHRQMPRYLAQQKQKKWQQLDYIPPSERHVAVLGLGNMGRAAAARLHDNGFTVTGWSRSPAASSDYTTVSGAAALAPLLSNSDIVIIVLPLTAETRHLFDAKHLSQIKAGSALINFGRGDIIDEAALLAALDKNISHAVLDVFAAEPLPTDHPFWTHANVTVLPHIAAETTKSSASKIAIDNIERWLATGVMPETVNRVRGY